MKEVFFKLAAVTPFCKARKITLVKSPKHRESTAKGQVEKNKENRAKQDICGHAPGPWPRAKDRWFPEIDESTAVSRVPLNCFKNSHMTGAHPWPYLN